MCCLYSFFYFQMLKILSEIKIILLFHLVRIHFSSVFIESTFYTKQIKPLSIKNKFN